MGRILDTDLCSCRKERVKCDECNGKKFVKQDGQKVKCLRCWGRGYTSIRITKRDPKCPVHQTGYQEPDD